VRTREQSLQALQQVGADQVREAFVQMLQAGAAIAVAGKLPRGADGNLRQWTAPLQGPARPRHAAVV
jgi:hypothetical protein